MAKNDINVKKITVLIVLMLYKNVLGGPHSKRIDLEPRSYLFAIKLNKATETSKSPLNSFNAAHCWEAKILFDFDIL